MPDPGIDLMKNIVKKKTKKKEKKKEREDRIYIERITNL